jgi:hypothetical protein
VILVTWALPMKFLPVSYSYYEGYIWAAALQGCLVAVSLERGAKRSGDCAYLTGRRDCKNACAKRTEDPVGRPWGFWATIIVGCMTRESEGCLRLPMGYRNDVEFFMPD